MRKLWIAALLLAVTAVSCAIPKTARNGSAADVLTEILKEFAQEEGFVYTDEANTDHPLTDAMLARMFPDEGDTADLFGVVSSAVYFSKRFCEHEIIVFKLCDISHTDTVVRLLQKRAKKKENAVVFADGVYVYLICTDENEAISRYLQE